MHVLMSKAVDLFRENTNVTGTSALNFVSASNHPHVHIRTPTSTPECLREKCLSATDLLRSLRARMSTRMLVPGPRDKFKDLEHG